MTTPRTALVIGAGIAGPVAAMALRKAGIRPTIYEAHPSGAEGIGTFLTIASNGINALRAIGADQTALAAGFPTPTITLRSTTGKNLGTARTGLTLPDGTTSHTLKRADLYQALYQEAVRRGIDVQHGKRLTAAEPTGNGVRAVFDDGTDAAADVLIGTGGVAETTSVSCASPGNCSAGDSYDPNRQRQQAFVISETNGELASHNRPEVLESIRNQFGPRMEAADIADAISYIVTRPRHIAVNEILIRPTEQQR
jgi:hypothetical protein